MVATLTGGKPLTAEIAKLTKELERLTPGLATAEKALDAAQQTENNEAGVAKAQAAYDKAKKVVDEKTVVLDKKKADLDALALKATADGKLAEVVAVGAKVDVDQPVAQIQAPTAPTATFKIPPSTKLAQDGTLSLTAGGQTVVCTISDAQAETVKVACPADSGLADGADVTFTLPR